MNGAMLTGLPRLLPKAIAWAEGCAAEILAIGEPLNDFGRSLATRVGVQRPDLIRIQIVSHLPLPEDLELRQVALNAGLLGEGMIGMTLGYGVYICKGKESVRLASHEFRHVHQYEKAGSIANFLPLYLAQVAQYGYRDAAFEVDARAHEIG
jgi:hypothetical protein